MNPDKFKNEIVPELAESFGVEFGNSLQPEIQKVIGELGFQYRRGENSDTQVTHIFERRNGDGTTMKIVIEKGANYKSPAKLKLEEEAKKNKIQ